METKKLISPFVLAGLFSLFAIACVVVYFQKGKGEKWLARKMKFGAAILAITTITTGCPPMVTCYDPMPTNMFSFDKIDSTDFSIIADLPNDSIITGTLYSPNYQRYAFNIIDIIDSVEVQKGEVVAAEGVFDKVEEKFSIAINSTLDTGMYSLNIFPIIDDQQEPYPCGRNQLKIK